MIRCVALIPLFIALSARAGGGQVAVSAGFERATGHRAVLSSDASGKFHAQVRDGAPLEVPLAARRVRAESIGQTDQLVATENARRGCVALSLVMEGGWLKDGSARLVPAWPHRSIPQGTVLPSAGCDNQAALALLKYLGGEPVRVVVRPYGTES